MELRSVGTWGQLNPDYWRYFGFPAVLRKPLSNLCRANAHDGVVRGVIIGAPTEHFYADHALTQAVHITREGVFYHQPEKVLAALAPGEGIARNHRFERTADGLRLFSAEFLRVLELMFCCHISH